MTREQEQLVRSRRKFCWQWAGDFEFAFRGLLPPEEAAVVLQALRAALGDPEHPHEQDRKDGIRWEEATPPPVRREDAGDLASALVEICAEYLNARASSADNPDTYQVVIHAGAAAITAGDDQPEPQPAPAGPEPADGIEPGRVSAETRTPRPQPGHLDRLRQRPHQGRAPPARARTTSADTGRCSMANQPALAPWAGLRSGQPTWQHSQHEPSQVGSSQHEHIPITSFLESIKIRRAPGSRDGVRAVRAEYPGEHAGEIGAQRREPGYLLVDLADMLA